MNSSLIHAVQYHAFIGQFDAIISSAVFFHSACELTCPDSTLEYGKTVKSHLSGLGICEEEGGGKKLPGQISGTICGGGGCLENQSPG